MERAELSSPLTERLNPREAECYDPAFAMTPTNPNIARELRDRPLFILPDGSNRDAVARLGQRFLDLTIEALATASGRPPLPAPADPDRPLRSDYEPPREGRDAAELIDAIRDEILGRVLNVSHPGYVGHMDTLPSAIGAFSDLLVSALNNNMLCWEMSPVFTEMEARLLRWITRTIGWPTGDGKPSPTGFLVSGGSLANLSAILAARNVQCGPAIREIGLSAAPGHPTIIASEEAHYSLDKIANILGLGAQGLVHVPTDDQLRLRPDALEEAIARIRRHGGWPFCVVGIAGTTVSGAIDPLDDMGEIARRHGLWFHVDAAYGGSLLVCTNETRDRLRGIEQADSVTFNPQKWLFVPKVCAGIFFRDSARVSEAVQQTFPYAGSANGGIDDPRRNVGEYTVQGTRRVDVLKLWLTLEHLGLDLLSALMNESLRRARLLAAEIKRSPSCQLLCEPQLNIVCFRYVPQGWDPEARGPALDTLNQRIHAMLAADDLGWIAIPRHRGRRWLRFVILHPMADDARLRRILEKVIKTGDALTVE